MKPFCPVGSSLPQETYSSGRCHTAQGDVGMGAQFGGAASPGGGVGAPHEERSSEVGKSLQRHHVLLLQAQCGSAPPAGPWAHCPRGPSACRMPAPHGCPIKGSLLASLTAAQVQPQDPGSLNCLCFLSQVDWTPWGSSAQGHKSFASNRNEWLALLGKGNMESSGSRGPWTGMCLVGLPSPSGNVGSVARWTWSACANRGRFLPFPGLSLFLFCK